jgi:polysaccharide export outer membrane protein
MGLVAGAVCLALTTPCVAQQGSGIEIGVPKAGDLKMNPLVALRAFEGPADEEYTLGRGDNISIDFGGRPELSVKRVIGPDGRVTLPPAGAFSLLDKTREQAAAVIAEALSPFYTRLSVTVGVDRYVSNRVLLLGAVQRPGPVTFDGTPTLLATLSAGGGSADSGGSNQGGGGNGGGGGFGAGQAQQAVPAIPERCAIYRGSDQVVWVDVKGLVDSGNPLADVRLKRGDVVYVPSTSGRYVSVLGQVQHPGALMLDSNTSLPKLIAEAGGLTLQAGKNPMLQVVSTSTGKSRLIPFKSLIEPGSLELTLKSGDVVYVPESGFNQMTYVFERLSPLISVFSTAALLGRQ